MKKVVIVILFIFLITGCSIKKVKELTDSEKFATEYNIEAKNNFVYADYDEIDKIFNTSGVIFLATPDSSGSQKSAEILNEIINKNNHEKIYYFNPKEIEKKNSKEYKKLIKYLKEYLVLTKDNEYELNLPILLSILDGNIVGYSNYLSKESHLSEEKLTKKKLNIIKSEYQKILNYKECRK